MKKQDTRVLKRAEIVRWQKHPELHQHRKEEETVVEDVESAVDYGRGFLVCLVKFARHWQMFQRLRQEKKDWFQLTMYAAYDHLFNVELPPMLVKGRIPALFEAFKDVAWEARQDVYADQDAMAARVREALDALCLEVDKLVFEGTNVVPRIGEQP